MRGSSSAAGIIALATVLRLVGWAGLGVLPAEAGTGRSGQDGSFVEQHAKGVAQNPPGVSLVLSIASGQSRFRPGERIVVKLTATSSIPRIYQFDGRNHEGRHLFEADEFHVDPPVRDPWADYFASIGGFFGDYSPSEHLLGERAATVSLDLNDWIQFEQPGRYRVFVVTRRFQKSRQPGEPGQGFVVNPPVASNIIEIEILPRDAQREAEIVSEAVGVLNSPAGGPGRRDAIRDLSFLGNEAAVKEMARRFDGDEEIMHGLFATRERSLAVRELERELLAPEHPISQTFLFTLGALAYQLEHGPMPPYPEMDISLQTAWQKQFRDRLSAIQEEEIEFAGRLVGELQEKRGLARAASAAGVVELACCPGLPTAPAWLRGLPAQLAAVFDALPADQQYHLLEYRWELIAGPPMAEPLRKIVQSPPKTQMPIHEVALRRLYSLAPDEGRQLILDEIRSGHPQDGIKALGLLSDKSLPELEGFLADDLNDILHNGRLEESCNIANLIARYATPVVLPQVQSTVEDKLGSLPCNTQAPLLAYLLRADPAVGEEDVKLAMASRATTGCYKMLFAQVADLHMSPELENIAIAHLGDRDLEVASNAAFMLQRHGSSAAEAPLWQRLEQWHANWAGRESELRYDPIAQNNPHGFEVGLEEALANALGQGPAWVLDAGKAQRLLALCVTENCRTTVAALLQGVTGRVAIYRGYIQDSSETGFAVAQYDGLTLAALENKLAQFPKGTVFAWRGNGSLSPDAGFERFFPVLSDFLQKHGMKLERAAP